MKREDYFSAGTLVVWDVDLLSEEVVKSYGADDLVNPRVFVVAISLMLNPPSLVGGSR